MRYEWDERKRKVNLRKHGLDFLDAPRVFRGATLTVADDRHEYGEERFITLGLLRDTVVAIAHTEHPKTIRIISMRKATRHEEKSYFAQIDYRLEADSEDEG
jgi:uncharacterized protein